MTTVFNAQYLKDYLTAFGVWLAVVAVGSVMLYFLLRD